MLPKTLFAVAVSFFFAATLSHADSSIEGGPGFARALNDVRFADDFSTPLDQRYIAFNTGFASSYVDDGVLVSFAGPYQSVEQPSSRVIFNRVLFPNDSFRISFQVGVAAGSVGVFVHGIGIFDPTTGNVFPLLSLLQRSEIVGYDPETNAPIQQFVRSVAKTSDDSNVHPFAFIDGQLYDGQIEYDALSQTVTVSVPAAEYTAVVPAQYPHGFMVGMFTLAADRLNSQVIGLTDNIDSDITFDTYAVSNTPLTYEGELYDDTLPAFFPGGSDGMVYYLDYPGGPWPLLPVSADGTYLNLDGIRDLNAYLISRGSSRATVYSPLQPAAFSAVVAGLVTVRTFKLGIFKAHGQGVNYTWHLKELPPSVIASCGVNCGSAGCNVPAAGVGSASNVNLANGNLFHRTQVVSGIPGDAGPQLHYNAHNGESVLGRGWSHAAMTSVKVTSDDHLTLLTPSGGEVSFRPVGMAPDGSLELTVVEGCCVGNYLRARMSAWAGIEIVERGGTTWHYPATGGGAVAKTSPAGLIYSYEYGANDRLTTSTDPYGRSYRFAYDDAGYLTAITDPAGATSRFVYEEGFLVKAVDPRGAEERYEYNAGGRMSRFVDKAGFAWHFTYDGAGRVVVIADAAGHTTQISYLANANAAVVTDRRGQPRVYEFDPAKNVIVGLTDALSRTTTQAFDGEGNMIRRVDPAGFVTLTEYDAFHQPTRTIDAAGGERTTEYNEFGLPTREVDPLGNVTTMLYDSQANLIMTTDALGNQRTAVYDAQGNKLAETNRAGETTTYDYQDGVVLRETNGAGESTWFEVDGLGRTTATIDGAGNRTQIGLDVLGLEAYKIYPDGFSVATYRDGLGRELGVSAAAEPRQVIASKSFDTNGNVTSTTTFLGLTAEQIYDAEGNQVGEQSPEGRERSFTYDDAGQNVRTIDGDGVQQAASYDARGNYAETLDANQAVTRFAYDELNRLVRLDIDDAVFTYTHDLNGNLIEESANGRVTRHAYDELNRRISTTDPLGNVTTFEHDAEGRIIRQTDPLGSTTLTAYDAAGRKIAQTNPDGGMLHWEYDERGLKSADIDALGHRTTHVYDSRGRLVDTIDPLGGHWRKAYDDAGRIIAEENPLGERTSYGLDADGRVIQKIDPLGRVTDYVLDADGNQIAEVERGCRASA